MKKQTGFTLIELIIVIIILGILAAYAVPKYVHIDKEARKSVVKGLEGSIRTAADLVHAVAIAQNMNAAGTVDIGTGNVEVGSTLYPTPTVAGIEAALADVSGFTAEITTTPNAISYQKKGAAELATCAVTYAYDGTGTPNIVADTSGC